MASADVQVYQDDAGEWRWRLKAENGEIVAVSESYTREDDAHRGWDDARSAFNQAQLPPEA